MNRLLSTLFGRKAKATRRTARPQLESLEDRWCPAVTITTLNNGHTLVVSGDAANNTVTIRDNAEDDLLQVVAGNVTQNFETSEINRIVVSLKTGNDRLFYFLTGGSDFEHAKQITVDLNQGNDQAFMDFANDGEGGEAKIEAPLSISGLMANGNDQMQVRLGEIEDENVAINAQMGNGNDLFRVDVLGDLQDDARLSITAFGQANNDSMDVRALDDIFIDDDAVFNVHLNGGTGNDVVRAFYNGELDGSMNLLLNGDQNNDQVRAILNLEDDSDGTLQARVLGGTGNDALQLTINDDSDGDVDILTALLDGGAGVDTQSSTANVTVINV